MWSAILIVAVNQKTDDIIVTIIIIIIHDAEIRVTLSLKVFQGHFTKLYYITVSLPEKRWQTVLSRISGGTQAVTGFP